MVREGINCPEHSHDLLPFDLLVRHSDSFAREIVEDKRILKIDIPAIPLDSQPGRQTGVQLFTRVENRVRALRSECTKAPYYPYDSYYLLTYLDHVSIWEPLIAKDAGRWITDWNRHNAHLGDEVLASKLFKTPFFRSSEYGHLNMYEAVELVRRDVSCRVEINNILLQSYIDFVMNAPDIYLRAGSPYKDTVKMLVIDAVRAMTLRGINPFDILYGMGDETVKRKRNMTNLAVLAMMVFTLFLFIYACVNDIDI